MQYIPCNSALLAKEALFLTKKGTFLSKDFQKVRKSRQILMLRQNSVCSGLKFLSESKLFGRGPPCPRTTSATLTLTSNRSKPIQIDAEKALAIWPSASL